MSAKLARCSDCRSFLPPGGRVCPHCNRTVAHRGPALARVPAPLRGLLAIGGGGLLSVTLSACYGAPCAGGSCGPEFPDAGSTCTDPSADTDGDGYCLEYDCDETSSATHDDATDPVGDMIDQNCDGVDGYAVTDAGA